MRFDEEDGTDFWRKAIEKEMKNVRVAFEFNDKDEIVAIMKCGKFLLNPDIKDIGGNKIHSVWPLMASEMKSFNESLLIPPLSPLDNVFDGK